MINLVKSAYAQVTNPIIEDPTHSSNPISFFNKALSTIFGIFFVVGVIYFVWHFFMAGYHWIAAEGDSKKIEQARLEITYALVGLGVIFVIFVVLRFIGTVFGISSLKGNSLFLPLPTLLN